MNSLWQKVFVFRFTLLGLFVLTAVVAIATTLINRETDKVRWQQNDVFTEVASQKDSLILLCLCAKWSLTDQLPLTQIDSLGRLLTRAEINPFLVDLDCCPPSIRNFLAKNSVRFSTKIVLFNTKNSRIHEIKKRYFKAEDLEAAIRILKQK